MKVNRIFLILFFSLILLGIFNLNTYAANAAITVAPENVEVGKPVTITVSGIGVQWNLKLKVDGQVLKTSSELENYEANKNISFSASYTPTTAGTKNVTLEGSVTEFSDGSTVKSFSPKTITVTEKQNNNTNNGDAGSNNSNTNNTTNNTTNSNSGTTNEKPKEKSDNAYLSTLGITPKEYDFSGFKKATMNYNVTIPYEIDELKVLYKTADSGATVKVTGNSNFEVGSNNKITINVTAEDGKTTKTYTIKVTKLAEEEEKPGNIIDDKKEGLYLTSLSIDGVELSPEFVKDTYSYKATLTKDISEVQVDTKANKENAIVEISGNKNLVIGENAINIVLKEKGSSVQTIYQILLTKEIVLGITDESDSNIMGDIMGSLNKYVIIAGAVVLLMIVIVIILIVLLRKENKRLKEEKEFEETNEYNVYENNENEFETNVEETKEEGQSVKDISDEKEVVVNKRKRTRREKGRHSK